MTQKLDDAIENVADALQEEIQESKDDAIEAANEALEAAQETAEQIAAAAMENVRGQKIEQIEQEIAKWRNDLTDLKMLVEMMQTQATETAALVISISEQLKQLTPPQLSPLTQPQPTPEQTPETIPEMLTNQSENIESAVIPKRVKRFL